MPLYRRPDWASFFTDSQYSEFIQVLEDRLQALGYLYDIQPEVGMFRLSLNSDRDVAFGMANLAQMCNLHPREEWPQLIDEFLVNLIRTATEPVKAPTFEEAKAILKLRLFPLDLGDAVKLYTFPLNDQFKSALALDYPDRVASISSETVQEWGVSADELFDIGMQNVWDEGRPDEQEIEIPDLGKIQVLTGDSFFTATQALTLDRYLIPMPEQGALVAVPSRHSVLYVPLTSQKRAHMLNGLQWIAGRMYEEGPGSISPRVFWWIDGAMIAIDLEDTTEGMILRGPEEFQTAFFSLPPE